MDQQLLKAAVKALGIDVPILKTQVNSQGHVEIWTRNGKQIWDPPDIKKTKSPRKRKKESDDEI